MKMIGRGSKADEPVRAVGEATEDARTEIFFKIGEQSLCEGCSLRYQTILCCVFKIAI